LLSLCSCDDVLVTLSTETISDSIAEDFASFSFEISGYTEFVGPQPDTPKSSFINLLNNLRGEGSKGPNIRIGGNSADVSWWDPDNAPKPENITYDIQSSNLIGAANVAKLTMGSIVFDLNMRQSKSPEWAVNHVKGIEQYIGFDYVRGIEIGNEVDLFHENGIRPKDYTFEDYEAEFQMYAEAIYAAGVPKPRIQGATWCAYQPSWNLTEYIRRFKPLLSTISFHRYPLTHCGGHISTIEQLLSDSSTDHQAQVIKPYSTESKAAGLPFYIGEGNSASCGGMPGVSNAYASALWAVDFLFNLASIDVKGMNFHGGGEGPYTAIGYTSQNSTVPDVRPLYYAMWVFATATRSEPKILASKVTSSNPMIKVWALENSKGAKTVVLIHKDPSAKQPAAITIVPSAKLMGEAQLSILKSKEVNATTGLSFAGQTFDGSHNGLPLGTKVITKLTPNAEGSYKFNLDVINIAVVELPQS